MAVHQKNEKKKDTNTSQQQMSIVNDEKAPKFLFVDSLAQIDLIVSFASLSRWYEQRLDNLDKPAKSKKTESFIQDHDAISVAESKTINKNNEYN